MYRSIWRGPSPTAARERGRGATTLSFSKGPSNQSYTHLVGLLRVQVLLEHDAQLVAQGLQLVQVLLVLGLVLDLRLDACCVFCLMGGGFC